MMRTSRPVRFFLSLLILQNIFLSGQGFAYRPLGTEDAGVAGKGIFQAEASWDYLKWNNGDLEQMFLLVPIYGVTERLELSAEIPYLIHQTLSHRGAGDINIVAKYIIVEEGNSHPAFTCKAAAKLDNGDYANGLGSGDKDFSLFAVASKTFGRIIIHSHLGYTWIGKSRSASLRDISLYGLAVDYSLTDSIHLLAEINGNRHPDNTSTDDPRNWLVGATKKLSEKLVWDFAVRGGLTKASPDLSVTTGLSATL